MRADSRKQPFLAALCTAALILGGCSTKPRLAPDSVPPLRTVANTVDPNTKEQIIIYDPFEGFNRGMYRLNYYLDEWVLLPSVRVYRTIVPDYAEDRVSDFFDNIGEIANFINATLQLNPRKMGITVGRFMVNTTFGIGGLWDIADRGGLHEQQEDFGQTLGYWGVANGPYLVLPFYGPSNLRDVSGLAVDSMTFSEIDPLDFADNHLEIPYYILKAIDTRKRVPFRYYGTGNPFEYELVRFLYTKKREVEVDN
ncbi:MAG: VacJ family lipoprotein [Desulfopila sp.]